MSTPNSPSDTTEQASWIHSPRPGKLESLRKFFSTRADMLFDGAYFGFNGESILMPEFDPEMNIWKLYPQEPSRGKIIAINPGAKKVSRLLASSIEGNSLALLQGRGGYEKLNHVEAENAKLVREVDYAEIFRYLGRDELVRIMRGYSTVSEALEKIVPWMKDLPNTAYQVTKEGQKSGLLLVNEEHQSNTRPPFFGGPGSFRRRRHATSH